MFRVSILTHIMDFGLPIAALAFLVLAVLAFLYVPLFGKQLAVGLIALSAATFAYDLGFERRAALDKSAALEAQIAVLNANIAQIQHQADEAATVAENARIAEQNAENQATFNQGKVDEYVAELSKRPVGDCGLTDDDVSRLRGIGTPSDSSSAPLPPTRPIDLWPANKASNTP